MVIHDPCWYTEGRWTKGYNSYHVAYYSARGYTSHHTGYFVHPFKQKNNKKHFFTIYWKKKNAKTMSQTSVMWSAQTSANKLEKNKISMNEILLVTFQARLLHYQADVFHITAVCFHFYSVRNLVTNPSRIREVLLILNLNGKEFHIEINAHWDIHNVLRNVTIQIQTFLEHFNE